MGDAVQQFVEMIRQAATAKQDEKRRYYLYCDNCGGKIAHTLKVTGDWERYTCRACGCQRSYRVR